jgi:hypothetical protein
MNENASDPQIAKNREIKNREIKNREIQESLAYTVFRVLCHPALRTPALRTTKSIMYYFFFLQYKAAFFKGRIPVTPVDHPLDREIPFSPKWVAVYLDVVAFWVRMIGFLLSRYGRRGFAPAIDFIVSMGELYAFAAGVYVKNMSTTNRPRYYGRPRFVVIHALDPHLMCIPSLHVMVVIRTYTKFRDILRSLGDEARFSPQIAELRRGALDITEAILYVKQHSVNCVSAAMYAMTRFDPPLFPEAEGRDFAAAHFTRPGSPKERDAVCSYIIERYGQFVEAGKQNADWRTPLLDFLAGKEG